MHVTYFAPRAPLPDDALDDTAYAAEHCKQTTPTKVYDLDLSEMFDLVTSAAIEGRKGDAGYIIAGECTTTRKEGGPAPFVLIDYDDRPEGPDWPLLDRYRGFAWTTAKGHPHWRVLIPLLVPMAHGKLECPFPGGHIRNRTQPAFLPTHPTDTELIEWRVLEGRDALDARELGKPAEERQACEGSMLGALFSAAGMVEGEQAGALIVRCPWQHEHTDGKGGGTVVFHDNDAHDGAGKFHCAHGHCSKRTSDDAIGALRALPAVAAELAHWPPPPILGRYTRVVEAPSRETDEGLAAKTEGPFPLMSPADFENDEPIPWVIDGLVSVGEPTLIVGGAGSGKTSAMVELALSVATGRDVWGKFRVAQAGPVVHVDYEQGKTLRRTYRAFAAGLGLSVPQLVREGLLRVAPLPREQLLDTNVTDKHLSAVGKELVSLTRGARLCIVNSLTASTNKVNENDAKIAAVFNLLSRITEITGCAFIVLHHRGKTVGGARGSSAIDGAVQTIFDISHRKGDKHTVWTHTKDRPAGGDTPAFKLHWSGPGPVQTLSAETIEEEKPAQGVERPEDRMQRAILYVMANKGISVKQRILECVRGKMVAKRTVWEDMLVRGLIEHVGSRYLVAAGVVAPATEPEGVRDEDE